MLDLKFDHDVANYDRYKAKHIHISRGGNYSGAYSPIVLFDTGELICTAQRSTPEFRGRYEQVGVTIGTSNDMHLSIPGGDDVPMAWLDDGGMQYLLHDWSTNLVVRLDGSHRAQPLHNRQHTAVKLTHDIPLRFQYNCAAYIGGAGLAPISHEKIKLTMPLNRAGYTPEQLEHIQMIIHTGQAAMKLTDHEAVHQRATIGADPDVILRCKTWQDMPAAQLPMMLRCGARKVTRLYTHLQAVG